MAISRSLRQLGLARGIILLLKQRSKIMCNTINKDLIVNFMEDNSLTVSQFCHMCHMGRGVYNKIMRNDYNFYITVLFRIARTLGVKISELFI